MNYNDIRKYFKELFGLFMSILIIITNYIIIILLYYYQTIVDSDFSEWTLIINLVVTEQLRY